MRVDLYKKYHCYKTNPTEIVKRHTLQRRVLEVYKPPATSSLKTCSSLQQISVFILCVIYFNFVYSVMCLETQNLIYAFYHSLYS